MYFLCVLKKYLQYRQKWRVILEFVFSATYIISRLSPNNPYVMGGGGQNCKLCRKLLLIVGTFGALRTCWPTEALLTTLSGLKVMFEGYWY